MIFPKIKPLSKPIGKKVLGQFSKQREQCIHTSSSRIGPSSVTESAFTGQIEMHFPQKVQRRVVRIFCTD